MGRGKREFVKWADLWPLLCQYITYTGMYFNIDVGVGGSGFYPLSSNTYWWHAADTTGKRKMKVVVTKEK